MAEKLNMTPPHYRSLNALAAHIETNKLGIIHPKEWQEQWAQRWVVYADLVAFGPRALRSETVVLNNIIRFDRASTLAKEQLPTVQTRRFSDATFAIASTFHEALGFAVALAHACLAFNKEFLDRGVKPFFIHLIVPRITMATGKVLLLTPTMEKETHWEGIDPKNIIAGSAIVKAYQMEKHSAGGLLTIDTEGVELLRQSTIRGSNDRVSNGLRRWVNNLKEEKKVKEGDVMFCRGKLVDVPWLLMRPLQNDFGKIWGATKEEADIAVRAHLSVWDKSVREFYSPQNTDVPLDTAKHPQAAIRHAVQCWQTCRGRTRPAYDAVPLTE